MTSTISNSTVNVVSGPQNGQNLGQSNRSDAPDTPQNTIKDQTVMQEKVNDIVVNNEKASQEIKNNKIVDNEETSQEFEKIKEELKKEKTRENAVHSHLTSFLAMIAEQRSSSAEDLINYFNTLEDNTFTITTKSSRPAVPAQNTGTLNNNNLVARTLLTIQSLVNAPLPANESKNIEIDISFAADTHTYVPSDASHSMPIFESSNHVQKLIGFISQYKVRTYANYADPQAFKPTQTPHLLAYLHGLLLGYSDRRRLAPVNNKPNIMRELFMIGQNADAHMVHDNMARALFTKGPLLPPPLANAHIGPFPYTQITQGISASFDRGAHILLPHGMITQQAIHHYMWLIWAMRERMPVAFRNAFSMNINFYGTDPANSMPFPDNQTAVTPEQYKAAIAVGYHLLHYMFNGDDDLLDFYVQRGCDALFRVHSFYTEGGLIRKTMRTVPLSACSGIYYINNIPSSPGPHIFNSPHPGISAALLTFSECLTLQAIYSYSGPKLVIFDPAYQGPVHNVPLNDQIPAENVWTINSRDERYAVAQAYNEIITRPEESQILQVIYSQMFGNTAPSRLRALTYSMIQSRTTVKNLRKNKNLGHGRPANQPALKFDTAIINRFHDPEVAYRLGLLADGIRPMHGVTDIDIVQELTYLFKGGDLRNCPGLLTLNEAALNNLAHLDADPSIRATYYTTLDGQVHKLDPRSRRVTFYQWHNHGLTARPYACHILESHNIKFDWNYKLAYPMKLTVLVSGFGIPHRMYRGPQFRGSWTYVQGDRAISPPLRGKHQISVTPKLSASRLPNRTVDARGKGLFGGTARLLAYIYVAQKTHKQLDFDPTTREYIQFLRWLTTVDHIKNSVRNVLQTKYDTQPIPDQTDLRNLTKEEEMLLFPIKRVPQADLKVNLFARLCLAASPLPDFVLRAALHCGLYNDVACAVIALGELLDRIHVPLDIVVTIMRAVAHNDPCLKDLSDFNKMLGLCHNQIANCLTELATLQGRGCPGKEPSEDSRHRLNAEPNPHEAKPDPEQLKQAIRKIYNEEFRRCGYPDSFSNHVHSSPFWCKNGSHHHPHYDNYLNRFEFCSSADLDKVLRESPAVYITQAQKLEHGKTRYIYNCDTVSYLYTDYVLHYVEENWASASVLLDPSRMPPHRLASLDYPEYCMIDYTDFNSQHSIASMKLVFETLLEYLPDILKPACQWIIESFDHMYLGLNKWTSTLPSGHRATTFINSILNKAYLMPYVSGLTSFHCGDDVLLCGEADYANLLATIPYELNPTKQSFGRRLEFLRIHGDNNGVYGYPARALASLCSGNWLNYNHYNWTPSLVSIINQVNTIVQRSSLSHCFLTTLTREITDRYPDIIGRISAIVQCRVGASDLPCYESCCYRLEHTSSHVDTASFDVQRATQIVNKCPGLPIWCRDPSIASRILGERSSKIKPSQIKYTMNTIDSTCDHTLIHPDDISCGKLRKYHPRSELAPTFLHDSVRHPTRFITDGFTPAAGLAVMSRTYDTAITPAVPIAT
ncbi:TPA_asm: RNA-dependent RNA polymerase [Trichomonas vaginalis virus 5]|uniref:RNA-directed RNA polymerase n=1 Tax=Trichomonas vaginalis virus 5 TaxID=3047136 RepID=A0A9Y0T7P2_9VIRU|nr:TPA_asm: RNA-dependent RNA polymerase [Trichomonas vaginalis virus 5]